MAEVQGSNNGNNAGRVSKAPDERRKDIIAAARSLYETQGIARTSIKDITEKVGVTRGLFYYYFPDKSAVTEAVMEEYTAEFVEGVRIWNDSRSFGDIAGAVRGAVQLLRRTLFDAALFKKNAGMSDDSQLNDTFTNRVITEVVSCIQDTTVEDYMRFHNIEISYVYQTFYVLIYGLVGLVKSQPDVTDEVLESIIVQSLHLDIENKGRTEVA